MEKVIFIETYDKKLHDNTYDAKKHLDKIYGKKLTSICHKLLLKQKYSEMTDYINDNLHIFIELNTIKNDMELLDSN